MKTLFEELNFHRYDKNGNLFAMRLIWKSLITVHKMANNKFIVETSRNNIKSNHMNCTQDLVNNILHTELKNAEREVNQEFTNEKCNPRFEIYSATEESFGYTNIGTVKVEVYPRINNLFQVRVDFYKSKIRMHIPSYNYGGIPKGGSIVRFHNLPSQEVIRLLILLKEKNEEYDSKEE